jgi:integrase
MSLPGHLYRRLSSVADVDFLRRVVHVRKQLRQHGKERVDCTTPRSRRDLPLPQVVADALAEHLHAFPPQGELIFTQPKGGAWWQMAYSRIFRSAAQAAGLPQGATSHDLRHHYASVLLAAGESVVAVAERLGHENATLVLTTYGHPLPDSEERTRRAVDLAWRAPDVPQEEGEAQ